jgi:hypothetical protein
LFPLPPPISEGNDSKDNRLVEYKEKLVMTYIDRENDFSPVCSLESSLFLKSEFRENELFSDVW